MGPQNNRQPLTVFAIGKYWARPLRNGSRHVSTHPKGYPKNLSQKGFCGAFSLKKRPPAPQRPRARRRPLLCSNFLHQTINLSSKSR